MDIMGTIEVVMNVMKPDDMAELIARSTEDREQKFIDLFIKSISRMECYKNDIDIANAGYIESQINNKLSKILADLKEKEINP